MIGLTGVGSTVAWPVLANAPIKVEGDQVHRSGCKAKWRSSMIQTDVAIVGARDQ